MADPRTPPPVNPIPDTTAPRQPAQAPTPVPAPQPGTQDATRPGQNQRDASQDAAAAGAAADGVGTDNVGAENLVQRSGGGADNFVQPSDEADITPVNPTTGN